MQPQFRRIGIPGFAQTERDTFALTLCTWDQIIAQQQANIKKAQGGGVGK
jgi:hypothetical protein